MKNIYRVFLYCCVCLSAAGLRAQPAWIAVEISLRNGDGVERIEGYLHFDRLPVERERTGNFHITNLVPLNAGEIRVDFRDADAEFPFVLTDYQGEHPFRWADGYLPVQARRSDAPEPGSAAGREEDLLAPSFGMEAEEPEESAPFSLEVSGTPSVSRIPLSSVRTIRFTPRTEGGFRREEYSGRFVQYSREAKGDNGTVRPLAATFFGGEGDERFTAGGFLADGRIFAGGTFASDVFDAAAEIQVLLEDTRHADFPPEERTDRRGRTRTVTPANTPLLGVFSPDLSRLERLYRFPWGSGNLQAVLADDEEDALYVVIQSGAAAEHLFGQLAITHTVENEAHVRQVRERAAARNEEPRFSNDSLVLRFAPSSGRIEWAVRFKHGWLDPVLTPDGQMMVRRGQELFRLSRADGRLMDQGSVNIGSTHTGMVVDPRDGSLFFGGEYHSHTGLEPWRCPFLRKFSPEGEPVWSAYDWTGPIVGTQFLRWVSDSAITGAQMDSEGRLLLSGWSDGGNSVLTRQPYDLREGIQVGGQAGSIWGAGVLGVSYLIQMDADTMEVSGVTRFMSYLPTSNTPNSVSIRDFERLDNGSVAITGGSAFALIETHDAWFEPWYSQWRTNRHAQARGGPYLAVYADDLNRLRLSTVLPGVQHAQLASQGDRLLVFGSARARNSAYGDETPTLLKNAVQSVFGGGETDAYLLLVDTAAEPRPIELPEKTW
ncbi:MAG: hypothetical protein JJU05_11585 [Verrucomicrobia bacterium]|nr:hypothetical protein [Verrucomicrobiota bacterium]MCH8528575.1 hypothetical protein [Kiritimatiellia bacterium]